MLTLGMTSSRRRQRAAVVVELAIVLPVLTTLLFACLEVGAIVADTLAVAHCSREGVRAAAVGTATGDITTMIQGCTGSLVAASVTPTYSYRALNSGTWGAWTTLTNLNGKNIAASGDQVRVHVSYPHHLVCGALFSCLADDPSTGVINLNVTRVMRRE
jgi:Flp pilus assembly protein TadG